MQNPPPSRSNQVRHYISTWLNYSWSQAITPSPPALPTKSHIQYLECQMEGLRRVGIEACQMTCKSHRWMSPNLRSWFHKFVEGTQRHKVKLYRGASSSPHGAHDTSDTWPFKLTGTPPVTSTPLWGHSHHPGQLLGSAGAVFFNRLTRPNSHLITKDHGQRGDWPHLNRRKKQKGIEKKGFKCIFPILPGLTTQAVILKLT